MQMIYLPEIEGIIQDNPSRDRVATMTADALASISIHVLGKAMAMAPQLVAVLDRLMDIEPDEYGDRIISREGMEPIQKVFSAFTMDDLIALIHYVHIVK